MDRVLEQVVLQPFSKYLPLAVGLRDLGFSRTGRLHTTRISKSRVEYYLPVGMLTKLLLDM